jgi:hypothetical protein
MKNHASIDTFLYYPQGPKSFLVSTQSLFGAEQSSSCIMRFKNQYKDTFTPSSILIARCLIKRLNPNHYFCISFMPRGSILYNFDISFTLSSGTF